MQLTKEEIRFIGKWAKTKERGQWHYILLRGLLWGMLVGGLSHLFRVWDELKAWDAMTLVESYASDDFFIRLLIYSAIGCGLHVYHWNSKTKLYNQLKNRERYAQASASAAQDQSQ